MVLLEPHFHLAIVARKELPDIGSLLNHNLT